jgi:hypothetical protein
MLTFLEAVAREEGFNKTGSRAQRNNNPGNINFGPFAKAHGGILETIPAGVDETPRFACFLSPAAGFAAMRDLLSVDYLGMTVEEALNKWAPPVENETNSYIQNVCQWTGLTPETVLTAENLG